jgi:hypothetical protein
VFGKDRLQGNTRSVRALLGTRLISNWVTVATPAPAEVIVSMIGPTHMKPTLSLMHLKNMARAPFFTKYASTQITAVLLKHTPLRRLGELCVYCDSASALL